MRNEHNTADLRASEGESLRPKAAPVSTACSPRNAHSLRDPHLYLELHPGYSGQGVVLLKSIRDPYQDKRTGGQLQKLSHNLSTD